MVTDRIYVLVVGHVADMKQRWTAGGIPEMLWHRNRGRRGGAVQNVVHNQSYQVSPLFGPFRFSSAFGASYGSLR